MLVDSLGQPMFAALASRTEAAGLAERGGAIADAHFAIPGTRPKAGP